MGGYYAAPACDTLPRQVYRDDHIITRGYAVGFGQWFFFTDLAPAIAFGRSARMSLDCHGYGVYAAARELKYCDLHRKDEMVLLVSTAAAGGLVDRHDEDLQLKMLKKFVQGAKEHPWSSHWRDPTGYISDYNNGRPVQTRRKSLPL
ncbi:hypothetical protein ACFORH_43225 [Amycolatopsis roodepoortensis]|uniref:Uncharacterized protein n=1 Tax=Amycolatopsis roodepoortensis TaxID=700274 RepID=A0ABR9LIC4_9PSEU|nr:hypothetical protein [Amycolatopsis roodepoortensis]MBE1580445.1 hypothetical protein [Amycolatopsis roodepoortensis]